MSSSTIGGRLAALWSLIRGHEVRRPGPARMTIVHLESDHDSLWEPLPPEVAEWMGMDQTMPGLTRQLARSA